MNLERVLSGFFSPVQQAESSEKPEKQLLTPANALDKFFRFIKNRITFHKCRSYEHGIRACLDCPPNILYTVHPAFAYYKMPGSMVKVVFQAQQKTQVLPQQCLR